MSDDLLSRFENSLESIPVPATSPAGARLRGQRMRRKRAALSIVAVVAFVGSGAAIAANWDPSPSRDLRPADPHLPVSPIVDQTASRVIDELGSLCGSFDFYFRAEIGGGEYRPVQCGMDVGRARKIELASPAPGDIRLTVARGPQVVIYAFDDPTTKDVWLESHLPTWGGRLGGSNYVVEVLHRSDYGRVREALSDDIVISRPTRVWTIRGGQVLEPLPNAFKPEVSLRSVTRDLTPYNKEVVGAQVGAYRNLKEGSDTVPAWVVTARRCVPQYGGLHDDPGCVGDQTHIIVDATTGGVITEVIAGA